MSLDVNDFEETMRRPGISKITSQAAAKPCGELEGK